MGLFICLLCFQIHKIVEKPDLLTIFRARKDDQGVLDVAILDALLKGNYGALQKYLKYYATTAVQCILLLFYELFGM